MLTALSVTLLTYSAMGRDRQKAGGRWPVAGGRRADGLASGRARRPGGSPAHLVPLAPSVCYSLTCTKKRAL